MFLWNLCHMISSFFNVKFPFVNEHVELENFFCVFIRLIPQISIYKEVLSCIGSSREVIADALPKENKGCLHP